MAEAAASRRGGTEGPGVTPEQVRQALAGLRAKALAAEGRMAEAEFKAEDLSRQAQASWDVYFEADREHKRLAVLINALEAL